MALANWALVAKPAEGTSPLNFRLCYNISGKLMGYFGIDNTPPKITDWLQAIAAAIAVPAAIITFIRLLKKDKEKAVQIKTLSEMMLESQKQTQEFEYQTLLMKESNEIFKEQLTIIASSLKQDKDIKSNMLELEKRKRKLEIRPRFIFSGALSQGSTGYHEVKLKNIGGTAYLSRIVAPENPDVKLSTYIEEGKMIQSNQEIIVQGQSTNDTVPVSLAGYELNLIFSDADSNFYQQKIVRQPGGKTYKIDNPLEFEQ